MRYPRPQSADQDDTASLLNKRSASGQNGNEWFPIVPLEDLRHLLLRDESNQNEDHDQYVVERRLWTGLTALRQVLASYEAEKPLSREFGGVDDMFGSASRGSVDRQRDESPPSQELGTKEGEKFEANSKAKGSVQNGRETPSTPDGAKGLTLVADTKRPTKGNSENEGTQVSETPTKSTSRPTATASARSRESRSSSGSTLGSKTRSKSNEGNRFPEAANSGRNEHGGIRRSLSKQEGGSAVISNEADDNVSSLSEAFNRNDRSIGAGGPHASQIPEEDGGRTGNRENRGSLRISPVPCGREGSLVRATDLEAEAQEGRRLASLAATTCEDLDKKEAALSR